MPGKPLVITGFRPSLFTMNDRDYEVFESLRPSSPPCSRSYFVVKSDCVNNAVSKWPPDGGIYSGSAVGWGKWVSLQTLSIRHVIVTTACQLFWQFSEFKPRSANFQPSVKLSTNGLVIMVHTRSDTTGYKWCRFTTVRLFIRFFSLTKSTNQATELNLKFD